MIKVANSTSLTGNSEYESHCEHVLEDLLQSLRTLNKTNATMSNDNRPKYHSTIDSAIDCDEVSNETSRFFDIKLSKKNAKRLKSYC